MKEQTTKSKGSDKRIKNKRKRRLKKKKRQHRRLNTKLPEKKIKPNKSQNINWKAVNMAANYWTQSRASILEWQHNHEIAYWESKAEALNYENKILHNIIHNIYSHDPKLVKFPIVKNKNLPSTSHSENVDENCDGSEDEQSEDEQNENEQSESAMVVSEEFMSFLKISMQHKMEREKQQEKNKDTDDKCLPPKKSVDSDRLEEMNLLYGKSSALITGIETKVQLNYDCFKDSFKPPFWPFVALNNFSS